MSVNSFNCVISWCLYVDQKNLDRLSEYLVGLKCNLAAAALWFPGWKLRLHIAPHLREDPLIWKYISYVCGSSVDIKDCRPDMHPMIERYSVLFDPEVDVSVIRDIDSILTKLDADVVNSWIDDTRYDVLQYVEYKMKGYCMGGGAAFKRPVKVIDALSSSTELTGRNHDESVLWRLIDQACPANRRLTYLTRMTGNGVYHFYREMYAEPVDSLLLWPIPFFDTYSGYAYDVLPLPLGRKPETVEDHVQFSTQCEVRDEHLHGTSQISAKQKWVR